MKTNRDFSELLECLTRHGVKALIVGAHALALYSRPRYTKDLDLLIEASQENAGRLLTALEEFGFGGIGLTVGDFVEPGRVVQLGYPPTRVDILTSITGVSFEEAWEGRVEARYGDVQASYIGREALIRNKTASGRTQDRADLEVLEAFSRTPPSGGDRG